jgi:hypothetical protein
MWPSALWFHTVAKLVTSIPEEITAQIYFKIFKHINSFKIKFLLIYKNSVRTSQETHYVSAKKPNRLMLFRERVAVYCENHMEHTDTLCGQNAELWCVYSNHWSLNVWIKTDIGLINQAHRRNWSDLCLIFSPDNSWWVIDINSSFCENNQCHNILPSLSELHNLQTLICWVWIVCLRSVPLQCSTMSIHWQWYILKGI